MNDQDAKPFDPELTLIDWLLSRTERGQLSWKIEHDKLTASVSVPPLVHLRFDLCEGSVKHERWSWFFLQGEHSELLRIKFSNASVNRERRLFDAANTLFIVAMKSTGYA